MMRQTWSALAAVVAIAALAAAAALVTAAPPEKPAAPETVAPVKEKIVLFNGKDLAGWAPVIPDPKADPKQVWSVKDGVIHCAGNPVGYLRTEKAYGGYRLTFDWCWAGQPANSGCLVHMHGPDEVWPRSVEVQLGHRDAGDFWVIGNTDFKEHVNKGDRHVGKKAETNEKPAGQWNTMIVVCQDDAIAVWVNGLLQNRATAVRDAQGKPLTQGRICFQSEGGPIEFRNIVLEPVGKQAGTAGK